MIPHIWPFRGCFISMGFSRMTSENVTGAGASERLGNLGIPKLYDYTIHLPNLTNIYQDLWWRHPWSVVRSTSFFREPKPETWAPRSLFQAADRKLRLWRRSYRRRPSCSEHVPLMIYNFQTWWNSMDIYVKLLEGIERCGFAERIFPLEALARCRIFPASHVWWPEGNCTSVPIPDLKKRMAL